jgi:3-oxoacyl-[acyl-carrier protein] reductase
MTYIKNQYNVKLKIMNTIFITGGTCDIGEELIKILEKKYNIIFTYNNKLSKAKDIQKKYNAKYYKLNLEELSSLKKVINIIKKKKIISFIHLATEKNKTQSIDTISNDTISKMLKANCIGSTILIKEVIKIMKKNNYKKKNIIIISSQAAKYGGNKISLYSASKAYLDGLVLSLSKEISKYIKINCITLGKVNTSGLAKVFKNKKIISDDIPMKRLGSAHEIAKSIELLIENFDYMSGADLKITGGR